MADNKWKKKSGLGKGLSALLENTEEKETLSGSGATIRGAIDQIDINQISVNPFQPRTDFNEEALNELADSIRVQGIIQPITVRVLNESEFQLISGERRLQASKIAGLKTIPAFIRTADDQQMLEMALIENIQRENLNAIEIALSYQRLLSECDLSQEELGTQVGKNRTTVTNYLRLLKLPPDIQVALRDNKITMGHARALINIENVDQQLDIFKKVLKQELSVRKTEELVRSRNNDKSASGNETTENVVSNEINKLQSKLGTHFGTKVSIKANKDNKGEIKIPFMSSEDLNRILEILNF